MKNLTERQKCLLTAIGFRLVEKSVVDGKNIADKQYYHLSFPNGDHLSICLSDGTEGGWFGNGSIEEWSNVQAKCDAIRFVLREEGLLECIEKEK